MTRPARFTAQDFIEAAIALVAEGGGGAATPAAIAQKVGGPTGSLYHRFESRVAILATAWITIHGDFARRVKEALDTGNGLLAALAILEWTREFPDRARFLLLNDPGSLIGNAPPAALKFEIERQEDELEEAFHGFVRTAVGRFRAADAEAMARARFLVFDGPIALISPHLAAREPIPGFVDAAIREMHAGVKVARSRAI